MTWRADTIKDLRRKMGWSYDDLARRLKCSKKEVLAWESGSAKPSPEVSEQLALFFQDHKDVVDKTIKGPQVEELMKQKGLDQVTSSDLEDL